MTKPNPSNHLLWHDAFATVTRSLNAHFDLAIAAGIAIVTLVAITVPYVNSTLVRPALGLLFVLFVPGYVLTAALFPRTKDIGDIERAALSLGLSIVIVSITGLVLNFTPWLIRLEPMLMCTLVFTFACTMLAVNRRAAISPEERFSLTWDDIIDRVKGGLTESHTSFDKALSAIILVSIITSTLTLGYLVVSPKGDTFTELYILGPYGGATEYPTSYVLGQTQHVVVGISNHENRAMTYDLVVTLNDTKKVTTLYSEQIALQDNQTLQKNITLKPDRVGDNMRMAFLLYKDSDHSAPYRSVYLWINVTKS